MVKHILPLIPKHVTYCEVFGGGASLLFAKEPSLVEVYNDIDGSLVDFFKVVSDPDKFGDFYRRVSVLPLSRSLFYEYKESWFNEKDLTKRVVKWFVVMRQSFSGIFARSWKHSVSCSRRKMAHSISQWLGCLDGLPEIHSRLQSVQVENMDFRKLINVYDRKETFFYLDPPYIESTRKEGKVYRVEMSFVDHIDLVSILLNIKGMVILSGYENEVYDPLVEEGWRLLKFETCCYSANTKREKRVEYLWMSPSCSKKKEDER